MTTVTDSAVVEDEEKIAKKFKDPVKGFLKSISKMTGDDVKRLIKEYEVNGLTISQHDDLAVRAWNVARKNDVFEAICMNMNDVSSALDKRLPLSKWKGTTREYSILKKALSSYMLSLALGDMLDDNDSKLLSNPWVSAMG